MRRRTLRPGFSLLELIAVITIMGVLVGIAVQRISISGVVAKGECCRKYRVDLNQAIERYRFENGKLPESLAVIGNSDIYPESIPSCPVTGQTYILDEDIGRISHADH